MQHEDRIRIQHMLDACLETRNFVQGKSIDDLQENRLLLFALIKCVEIIGEAASRVDSQTRDAAPHIPWREIIAMRNRLIHAYFDIDPEIIWKTVTDEVPRLINPLEELLK